MMQGCTFAAASLLALAAGALHAFAAASAGGKSLRMVVATGVGPGPDLKARQAATDVVAKAAGPVAPRPWRKLMRVAGAKAA